MESADERPRVLALLERHGWNATSFQILEPGFRYWFDGDDACVGYVDTGRAWVAAGPPIAPPERLADVTARFVAAAADARRRVCCFATEARFRDAVDWRCAPHRRSADLGAGCMAAMPASDRACASNSAAPARKASPCARCRSTSSRPTIRRA
jgi:hypothetical protein